MKRFGEDCNVRVVTMAEGGAKDISDCCLVEDVRERRLAGDRINVQTYGTGPRPGVFRQDITYRP